MPPGKRTRILIVDDSAVMRSLLRSVVATDAGLEVAGVAADGRSALASIESLRPDVVLLDVEMPVMDGLSTLRKLRESGHRMPVIMCSSLTQRGARVTIQALAGGASDYVTKPSGQSGIDGSIRFLKQELLPKIHALAGGSAGLPAPFRSSVMPSSAPMPPPAAVPAPSTRPAVVVIGVSTGGPAALDVVLTALPTGFPLPVLIVQHMPEMFTKLLAEHLNQRCALQVHEAEERMPIQPGNIYIARGNWHLEIAAAPRPGQRHTAHLSQTEPQNHCRPAADVLFRSAVAVYGAATLAVVLTGMGSDGLAGCRQIRAQGGIVLAQDQPTSAVWGMPGAVIQAGLAYRVLPLTAVAAEIVRLAGRTPYEARELRETVA